MLTFHKWQLLGTFLTQVTCQLFCFWLHATLIEQAGECQTSVSADMDLYQSRWLLSVVFRCCCRTCHCWTLTKEILHVELDGLQLCFPFDIYCLLFCGINVLEFALYQKDISVHSVLLSRTRENNQQGSKFCNRAMVHNIKTYLEVVLVQSATS